jgi:hypothetical protein
MATDAQIARLMAGLDASSTGRQLQNGVGGVLPTATADPSTQPGTPVDGYTVGWTTGGLAYISTYYAALGAWKKVQLT